MVETHGKIPINTTQCQMSTEYHFCISQVGTLKRRNTCCWQEFNWLLRREVEEHMDSLLEESVGPCISPTTKCTYSLAPWFCFQEGFPKKQSDQRVKMFIASLGRMIGVCSFSTVKTIYILRTPQNKWIVQSLVAYRIFCIDGG